MKNKKTEKFDLFVSLGGNCAAAMQLKRRNLRRFSLPFDYFFFNNENEYNKVLNAFKTDFNDCFQEKNFVELVGNERGSSDIFQYKDLISGYRIIHLFEESLDKNGAYKKYGSKI